MTVEDLRRDPPHGESVASRRDGPEPNRSDALVERLKAIAGVLAPTTVVGALLYYYGYVTSYARFDYFGLDLGVLGLSSQELVVRSLAALYVPLAVLILAGVGALWAHLAIRDLLATGRHRGTLRRAATLAVVVGVLLLARAAVGVLVPTVAATEPIATTPTTLVIGAVLVAYGRQVRLAAGRFTPRSPTRLRAERVGWALTGALVVLGLFWIANSFAAAYGRGQAMADAADLAGRPAVTLDTTERLYTPLPGVIETRLPADRGQRFRYRYRGLHLLLESDSRLYLVSADVSAGPRVLVVPFDTTTRFQFAP